MLKRFTTRTFACSAALPALLAAGDTETCLSGRAMGLPFEVCGPIEATLFGFGPGGENSGCGRGAEVALALPALLWLRRRIR